jgi:hypothetical protein
VLAILLVGGGGHRPQLATGDGHRPAWLPFRHVLHRYTDSLAWITAAELSRLIEAANAVCEQDSKKPELVVLRRLSCS